MYNRYPQGTVRWICSVNPMPRLPLTPGCSLSNIFVSLLLRKINIIPDQQVHLSSSLNPVLSDMTRDEEETILFSIAFHLQEKPQEVRAGQTAIKGIFNSHGREESSGSPALDKSHSYRLTWF